MKKHLFASIIISIVCSINILAQQTTFKPEWNVGVGGGLSMSSMGIEPQIRTKTEMRYMGGLAVRYITEKNLGLIAELNYSQQGWSQDFSKYDGYKNFAHTHELNYLELPILTHIYFGNKVRFFFNLGPKFSFLLSERETINTSLQEYIKMFSDETSNKPAFEIEQFGKKAERKFDYGLLIGGGLEFRSGIGNFMLEGRYSFGLGDIYSNKKTETFDRSANRVIVAKLTYYTKLF